MDFEPTDRCKELLERVRAFMDEHIFPVEREVDRRPSTARSTRATPFPADPRRAARAGEGRGPVEPLPARPHDDGPGLTNGEYGASARRWGGRRSSPPYVFNCQPPDSGNMEILAEHADARAARALARAAARGRDPQLLLDDRARHRRLGPDRAGVPRRARRRRVGDQRAQVVDDRTRSARRWRS